MNKIKKRKLIKKAKDENIDPDGKSYEELRKEIEIITCRHCGDEHFGNYPAEIDTLCSDTCEAEYVNENY